MVTENTNIKMSSILKCLSQWANKWQLELNIKNVVLCIPGTTILNLILFCTTKHCTESIV